jgi:hypothetical protein
MAGTAAHFCRRASVAEICTTGENELVRIVAKLAARTAVVTEEKIHWQISTEPDMHSSTAPGVC